jgi:hypothetical protein
MYNYFTFYKFDMVLRYIYNMYKASVSPGVVQQIMPYFGSPRYIESLDTWTVVWSTSAKFKPLTFSVTAFAFSNIVNIFVHMILYVFCLLSE